jgi:hypothetical protein
MENRIDLSSVPIADLAREMSRRAAPSRAIHRKYVSCPYCDLDFYKREMRLHLRVCTANPHRRSLRKGVNGNSTATN